MDRVVADGRLRLARGERLWLGAVLLLAAAMAALPGFVDVYSLSTFRDALIFGVFALSLDFLWGKTGVMSFGHATFFGLGAYGMAVVTIKLGLDTAISPWLGLLAGMTLAGAVSAVVGYFLIFGGVRGPYFTIVTLALTIVAQQIAIGWSQVTGGDSGLIGVPPLGLSSPSITFMDLPFYYLVLGIALAALLGLWLACRGRYGRILAAIQDNEPRARSLGYNTAAHLLLVFVLSAILAALAGGVYATGTGFVAPDMIGLLLSTEVIMWVAVGGRGTLVGPFIGTVLVTRLQQEISSIDTKLWPLAIGAFFIIMVFLFPDGVLSLLRAIRNLRARQARRGAGR
ncbi:MAG TPA: branched-chain amino acid ABC transporter permease [Dongiaceae bacterium]|nr:branched-chain amino acid ABC transporter permease [Dongiaceae bacterium]